MTIASPWQLDRDRLEEALALWKRRRRFGDQRYVDEFLAGPPGRRIVIVYVPTLETRRVAVADINYG